MLRVLWSSEIVGEGCMYCMGSSASEGVARCLLLGCRDVRRGQRCGGERVLAVL